MAVLNVDAATTEAGDRPRGRGWWRPKTARRRDRQDPTPLQSILFGALPSDVGEEEYTVAMLFRASCALNLVTGGRGDMTFSARCYLSQRIARPGIGWLLWRFLMISIDLTCAQFRGETEHCATAWVNDLARRGRKTF